MDYSKKIYELVKEALPHVDVKWNVTGDEALEWTYLALINQRQKIANLMAGNDSKILEIRRTANSLWTGPKIAKTMAEVMSGNGMWQWSEDEETKITDYDSEYSEYIPKPVVCECGSEKAGALGHSTWCPKREDK